MGILVFPFNIEACTPNKLLMNELECYSLPNINNKFRKFTYRIM